MKLNLHTLGAARDLFLAMHARYMVSIEQKAKQIGGWRFGEKMLKQAVEQDKRLFELSRGVWLSATLTGHLRGKVDAFTWVSMSEADRNMAELQQLCRKYGIKL